MVAMGWGHDSSFLGIKRELSLEKENLQLSRGCIKKDINYNTGSSAGKESTCNAGDPGSSPGLRSSTGEGTGYPFQYSWSFLVAQLVRNLPAMWEPWVQSLGWEDPLEKGAAPHSGILAWRIP